MSIIVGILALGFIIFFHELGHFAAAKLFGVGVLEFSIGMGPRLISGIYKNTRYSLKMLPIGGSCAMLGEDSAGSGDLNTAEENDDGDYLDYDGVRFHKSELPYRSFNNKGSLQRFIICIAGVFNNFLLAFLLAIIVCHFTGFDKPVILGTEQGSPVSEVGLERGDVLKGVSIDGKNGRKIHSFRDLYIYLYIHSGELDKSIPVEISYFDVGTGNTENASFYPYYDASADKYRLGISFQGGRVRAEGAAELIGYAFYELKYNVRVVLDSLMLMLRGRVERSEVMGPVGAVSIIGSTVEESTRFGIFNAFIVLLELCIMLSANLGVMNLLPIPALDGGRLLFILAEMLSRRRLDAGLEEKINRIGMIILLALMAVLLSNDVFNVLSGAYRNMF